MKCKKSVSDKVKALNMLFNQVNRMLFVVASGVCLVCSLGYFGTGAINEAFYMLALLYMIEVFRRNVVY